MRKAGAVLRDRRTWRAALWVLAGLTVAFILSRSMRGKVASDGESQWVTDLLREIFHSDSTSHAFVRKLAHFTEFFIRGPSVADVWLDTAGATCGIFLLLGIRVLCRKCQRK